MNETKKALCINLLSCIQLDLIGPKLEFLGLQSVIQDVHFPEGHNVEMDIYNNCMTQIKENFNDQELHDATSDEIEQLLEETLDPIPDAQILTIDTILNNYVLQQRISVQMALNTLPPTAHSAPLQSQQVGSQPHVSAAAAEEPQVSMGNNWFSSFSQTNPPSPSPLARAISGDFERDHSSPDIASEDITPGNKKPPG